MQSAADDVVCVIPTHLRPASLVTAVMSVLKQTQQPREIVVVDDTGTTQEDELSTLANPDRIRLRLVRNDVGPGAAMSRNIGAQSSDSALIAFMDDDDRWDPSYLASATRRLSEDQADAVITGGWWDVEGQAMVPKPEISRSLRADDVLAINPGMTGSNLMVTRPAFEKIDGFDTALTVSEDKDFLVRFLDAGLRYTTVPERLVFQSVHQRDRLSRPSRRRIAALAAYEQKYQARLDRRQRWQLRAKRARVRRRAAESRPERVLASAVLALSLINGGLAEGRPVPVRSRPRSVVDEH